MSLSSLKAGGPSFIGHKNVNIDSDSQVVMITTVSEKEIHSSPTHDNSQTREFIVGALLLVMTRDVYPLLSPDPEHLLTLTQTQSILINSKLT